MRKVGIYVLGLVLLFAFRLLMGLSKFHRPDALQVYLIGLKSYLEDTFPFFGPDVVYTETQIPGALQGLLVSVPLQLTGLPEAPYMLLNVLSFSVLALFAWYLTERFTGIPKWFTWVWVMTCPWVLHYSVHIENPSYVIIGAIPFFLAVFELSKFYSDYKINRNLLFFFMGFALFWIMQVHLSWVLMLPLILWIGYKNWSNKDVLLKGSLYFFLGCLISSSTLIPTLWLFDTGNVESNVVFNPKNLLTIPTTILRFLSFASYEIGRFLGSSTEVRINYLTNNIWAAPFIILLLLISFAQVGYMIYAFFKSNSRKEWNYVRWFVLGMAAVLCGSFLFSVVDPRAHAFYMLFPLAMWYSFYCFESLFENIMIKRLAMFMLIAGVVFQVSQFASRYNGESLFAHYDLVEQAIAEKDYTLLDKRRETTMYKVKSGVQWIEKSEDSTLIHCTDFLPEDQYFRPQNVILSPLFQDQFVCKIDSIQPYGIAFHKSWLDLGEPSRVIVHMSVSSNHFSDFTLVCEIKSKDDQVWFANPIKGLETEKGSLINQELNFTLPQPKSEDAEVQFYLWQKNRSGAKLYIEELCFEFRN